MSMSGENYEKGCPGAVWKSSGNHQKRACESKYGHYPWWGTCCEWKNDKCIAKRKISFCKNFNSKYFSI